MAPSVLESPLRISQETGVPLPAAGAALGSSASSALSMMPSRLLAIVELPLEAVLQALYPAHTLPAASAAATMKTDSGVAEAAVAGSSEVCSAGRKRCQMPLPGMACTSTDRCAQGSRGCPRTAKGCMDVREEAQQSQRGSLSREHRCQERRTLEVCCATVALPAQTASRHAALTAPMAHCAAGKKTSPD